MPDAPPLILASTSPRRGEILASLGVDFETAHPNVDELTHAESPRELVLTNARLKCDRASSAAPQACVLAADTVVVRDDEILGKPVNMEEALAMLTSLSGRTHEVHTGMVFHTPGGHHHEGHFVSEVTFRELSREEILAYFERSNPLDKAGGYDIGTHGERLITHYSGDASNIMGLNRDTVATWLKTEGIC